MYTGIVYLLTIARKMKQDVHVSQSVLILQDSMDSTEVDDSSRVLPLKYLKKGGITRFTYTHSSCPGLTCSLTCTSLGPYVMVHGMSFCTCWLYVHVCTVFDNFDWCNTWKVWLPNGCLNVLNFRVLSLAGVFLLGSWAKQFTLACNGRCRLSKMSFP